MFKAFFKNYLKRFRYLFMVLGILFLFQLISIRVLSGGVGSTVTGMINNVKAITHNSDLSFDRIRNSLRNTFKEADKKEVLEKAKEGTLREEVKETFGEALAGTIENYAGYASEISVVIAKTILRIVIIILISLFIMYLAFIVGHDVLFVLERYGVVTKNIITILAELLLRNLMLTTAFALSLFAAFRIGVIGIIILCLYPFIYCFLSLLCAWIFAGKDRPAFKEVVSFRNLMLLFAENIIVLAGTAVLMAIMFLIGSALISIYLGSALMILAAADITLNSSAFADRQAITAEEVETKIEEDKKTGDEQELA